METNQIRVLDRTFDILDVIRRNQGSAGVTFISKETGLPKSTVFRILNALVGTGYIRKNPNLDQYALGYKLIELSFSAVGGCDVINLAMPFLEQIKDEFNETGALAVKIGIQYCFVTQASCPREYRVNSVLGERYYLHWAGTGKAILAFSSEQDQKEVFTLLPHTSVTENTIKDAGKLVIQIKEIKETGFAYSFSERIEGGASFSAPLLNTEGMAIAAISIIGPEVRLRKMEPEITGRRLVEIARQLAHLYQVAGVSMEYCV